MHVRLGRIAARVPTIAPLIEERERLQQSTREQEIRNRAYEIYMQCGAQPGYQAQGEPHGGYRHV
jgi:hypothetical protein